jgi:hypothetical protein
MSTTIEAGAMSLDSAGLDGFHDSVLRELLALRDQADLGEAATRYINWLDTCREDATALRDVAVYKLHHDQGLGALRIANLFGLQKARGRQLIMRASASYPTASQVVARIRRRLANG